MALAVAATIEPTSKAVRFTITGATSVDRLTIDAYPQAQPAYRVRSMFTTVGSDIAATDGDAPFGVPVSYVVTDTATGATATTAAPVQVDSTVPMLSDALNPSAAVAVVVKSQKPNTWEARSVWWDVLGARAPFVSVAPMRYRNGDVVLYTEDNTHRDDVLRILTTGDPFVLRTPCGHVIDDVIGLPVTVTDALVDDNQHAGPSLLTITYQAVARELGPYAGQAGRTYGVALSQQASYDIVAATFRDYAGYLSGVPK